jgi:tellurite resistance protein TerC
MIAGASWGWWIGFHAAVLAFLIADSLFADRLRSRQRAVWIVPALLVVAALALALWIGLTRGRTSGLEFLTGYTVELSLSIDNLFVFMILLEGFAISPVRQARALRWGVAGAMVLRGIFVAAGVALLVRFSWVSWCFGAFLLYAAGRLARGSSPMSVIPGWIRNLQPARGSLLPVILAIEFTDLVFATDSVPAVLSITHNPFLAYTSNIVAILGLRSLYFAVASLLGRLRFLHYALAFLLGFVGLKMLASPWFEIPVTASLAVIGAILAVFAVASALLPAQKER